MRPGSLRDRPAGFFNPFKATAPSPPTGTKSMVRALVDDMFGFINIYIWQYMQFINYTIDK